MRRTLLAALVTALFGCELRAPATSAGIEPIEWPAHNDRAADTFVVDDAAAIAAPSTHPEPSLTLGRSTDDASRQFGIVGGIAVDSEKRIYVLDRYFFRIRVYDSRGSFIRDIGRRGGGPAEFSQLHGPGRTQPGNGIAISGDTLWVLDGKTIKAFDTAGSYILSSPQSLNLFDAVSIESTTSGLHIARVPFTGTGLRLQSTIYNAATGTLTNGFYIVYTFVRSKTRNLPEVMLAPVPLPNLFFDVARNGAVYFAVGDSFHVRRLEFDGSVSAEYVSNTERRRVTKQDIEDFVSGSLSRRSNSQVGVDPATWRNEEKIYRARIKGHPKADYREVIRQLIVSDAGDALLRRSDRVDRPYLETEGSLAEWTWISASGDPKARVMLPATFTPKAFYGCELYGTAEDVDGAQLVQHYSLDRRFCGA